MMMIIIIIIIIAVILDIYKNNKSLIYSGDCDIF